MSCLAQSFTAEADLAYAGQTNTTAELSGISCHWDLSHASHPFAFLRLAACCQQGKDRTVLKLSRHHDAVGQ